MFFLLSGERHHNCCYCDKKFGKIFLDSHISFSHEGAFGFLPVLLLNLSKFTDNYFTLDQNGEESQGDVKTDPDVLSTDIKSEPE